MSNLEALNRDMMIPGCKREQKGKGIPIGIDGLFACPFEVRQIVIEELVHAI